MITVHLPDMLRSGGPATIQVPEPAASVEDLIHLLSARVPDLATYLDDGLLNFAVNDEMILVRLRDRALHDGDQVEVIPTISGG